MRVPRKKKKQIPKGYYCYETISEYKVFEDGVSGYEVKTCPFVDYVKFKDMKEKPNWVDEEFLTEFGEQEVTYCKLIKYQINDMCKSCSIKLK